MRAFFFEDTLMPTPTSPTNDAPLSANRRPAKAAAEISGENELQKYELIGRTVTIAKPRAQVFEAWRGRSAGPTCICTITTFRA